MIEEVFPKPDTIPDFWELSDLDLARSCLLIADNRPGPGNAVLKAEAMRLFLLWRETINSDHQTSKQKEERTQLMAGLRKRTIQVLVRLSQQGFVFIP